MPREIGWSQEDNLLYEENKKLSRLGNSSGGGGGGTNYWTKLSSTIFPSNGEFLGFGITTAEAFTHFKNTVAETDLNFEIVQPSNYGSTYPTYLGQNTGVAERFYRGWAMNNTANAGGSGRPDVVGTFWSYNHNAGGGRYSLNEAAFGFRTETHYESGGQQLFEFHLPEFIGTDGVAHRLLSWYTPKSGLAGSGGPRIETTLFELKKWGDQNTGWAYIDEIGAIAVNTVRDGGSFPQLILGSQINPLNGINYGDWVAKLTLEGGIIRLQHGTVSNSIANPTIRVQTMDNFWVGQQPGYGGSPTNDQRGIYVGGWIDLDNRTTNLAMTVNNDGTNQWTAGWYTNGGSSLSFGINKTAVYIGGGNTASRPTSLVNGLFRYNSETNQFEGYKNGSWVTFTTS